MKNILAVLVSTLALSPVALAQTASNYSNEALELLEVATQCPNEVAQLSKLGRVASATHTIQNDVDTYTIQFVKGGYAPTFSVQSAGTVIVTRTFHRSTLVAPDAPGGKMVYSCQIGQ